MAAKAFDPHTCSHQTYPQALVEPWPGPVHEPMTYRATALLSILVKSVWNDSIEMA